jgi:CRP/FNR family transcriptional regulator
MPTLSQLQKVSLFKDLSDEELKKVSKIIKKVTFRKGKKIWEEGAPEQGLHIIVSGKVRISRKTKEGDKQVLAVLKKENFIGELSLLDGRSHSATAEALLSTVVLVIKKADMDRLMEENPTIAYKVMRELAIEISQILREMNYKFIKMVDYLWN